jgi:hypothetical protein
MKMSPSTNYDLFGGVDRFNRMMTYAEEQRGKK